MTGVETRRELFTINAVPAKDILRNKARVCSPLSAVCELLDNIFDNYDETGSRGALEITIEATGAAPDGEILIRENSGGVARTKLEPLVRLFGVRTSDTDLAS
ncbi:MAG: hypothetical protein FJX64_10780 [Alphaproteobacteria bacterium]|nr:hypothetical protein [Alphaproteobacteria bacterium]